MVFEPLAAEWRADHANGLYFWAIVRRHPDWPCAKATPVRPLGNEPHQNSLLLLPASPGPHQRSRPHGCTPLSVVRRPGHEGSGQGLWRAPSPVPVNRRQAPQRRVPEGKVLPDRPRPSRRRSAKAAPDRQGFSSGCDTWGFGGTWSVGDFANEKSMKPRCEEFKQTWTECPRPQRSRLEAVAGSVGQRDAGVIAAGARVTIITDEARGIRDFVPSEKVQRANPSSAKRRHLRKPTRSSRLGLTRAPGKIGCRIPVSHQQAAANHAAGRRPSDTPAIPRRTSSVDMTAQAIENVGCPSWIRIEPCASLRSQNFGGSLRTSGR
jgi:hypothetical protein